MQDPSIPNEKQSHSSSYSSVITNHNGQNTGKKRCQPEKRKPQPNTKRTARKTSPLSDITNITILESSPLFDSNCSTGIISSNSVNYDESTHQNNVVRVNTTSRSDPKVVSLDIYFKCS